jgi:hypothetical protein
MQAMRLRKNISPLSTSEVRASALWEVRDIPGLMLRRMEYLAYSPAPKGWRVHVEYDPDRDENICPLAHRIARLLQGQEFRTRTELLNAVVASATYLESHPAQTWPVPF